MHGTTNIKFIELLVIDLGTVSWAVSLISWLALQPLPQKNLLPNRWRDGWLQSWSGCLEENKFLVPARIWTEDPRSSSLETINYTVLLCHNMTALTCRMTIMVHQKCKCHHFLSLLRKHGRCCFLTCRLKLFLSNDGLYKLTYLLKMMMRNSNRNRGWYSVTLSML